MKREGHQHGVVRSFPILPTPLSRQRRYVKTVDSSSMAGTFTKVSTKPTNHSKFTGKCGTVRCLECHMHPVCKSKDKAKGTMKLRSIGSEHIDCPAGTSVIDALAYLANDESYDAAIDDYEYNDDVDFNDEYGNEIASIVREELIEDEDDGWFLVEQFE
ncbi:hypothetical protein QVD17_36599 [Tagetes erecta]|uniref:Uncharacterized protein n=1 Tax=Tagetes erecta TaxID=13708 RepID=A0AAD8JWN1_TARER|nr:hypothetical protein QVD17_36599 [Tagetes erecta]